jgi:CHAT domain-containing protein
VLELNANQYLRVAVDQKGVDVEMVLFGPDDKMAGEVSLPRTLQGRKVILLVTEQAGNYRLEVRSFGKEAPGGRYQIEITDLRDATETDKTRLALRKTADEANRLLNQGTAQALNSAVKMVEDTLPRIRAIEDRWGEANALTILGAAYYRLSEYQKTIEVFNSALAIWREVPDGLRGQALAISYIANSYDLLGEWPKVIESLKLALPIYRSIGDRQGEGKTLSDIGAYYWRAGDRDNALEYFNLALPILRGIGEQQQKILTLRNIGVARWEAGDREEAIAIYNQALELSRSIGYARGEAGTLERLAHAHYMMGENQKALGLIEKALVVNSGLGDRGQRATLLRTLGAAHTALGENSKALEPLNESLSIARAIGDIDIEARALHALARAHRDLNLLGQARVYIESAIRIIESLRSQISDLQLRSFYSHWVSDYYELYIDILMRSLNAGASADGNALGLEASERFRARSLLDLLNEARVEIRQGVTPELLKRERTLQHSLNSRAEHQIRLLNGRHTPEQASAAAKQVIATTAQLEEVRAEMRAANPRYAALTHPEPLSLKEIQEQILDADTLLLEYALGDRRSYLWAVTSSSIAGFELPGRAVIEAAARRYYDLLRQHPDANGPGGQTPRRGELEEAGERLSRMVLGPVAERLGTRRLAIVADGGLQYVPFASLPRPAAGGQRPMVIDGKSEKSQSANSGGRFLIFEHEIVNLPSASTLAVLRRELKGRTPAPKLVAVLADPVFDVNDVRLRRSATAGAITDKLVDKGMNSGLVRSAKETGLGNGEWPLPRLLGTRREATAILAFAPESKRRQALDFEANREVLRGADISQYQIIHFATHGILNSRNPELSGIVLSLVDGQGRVQDGFLRLHEIYNLRLPAELVVLSACQTGLGKQVRGEGLIGLTRGFMYAGAPRLVTSLWQVDDKATSELMSRFYRGIIQKKMTAAAALRAAQTEMARQKDWQSPYYWAAFSLQGEWR